MDDNEKWLLDRFETKKRHLLDNQNFLSEQDFLELTQLTQTELEKLKEQHHVIFVESNNGDVLYPEFQLVDGQVSQILAECLPRLYESRSGWDICFWLFECRSVLLTRAAASADSLKGISLDEALEVGRQAKEDSERFNGLPIDALRQQKEELFKTLVEAWLNPDYREIPKKPLEG